ncbi:SH3 domain-containing protein [Streptomyces nigrescens]
MKSASTYTRLRTVVAAVGAMAMAGLGVGTAYASEVPPSKPTSELVMTDALNFRAGPNTDYVARGMLYANDEVEIISYRNAGPNQWDKVRLLRASAGGLPAGSVGWVKQSYLTPPTCASAPDDQCDLYGGG